MTSIDPQHLRSKRPSSRRSPRKKKSDLRHFTSIEKFQDILPSHITAAEYIIFDIETTGGNPERNGLTEFCGLRVIEGEVVESFDTLINPQISIPPIVRKMTGITDKMVRNAPTIEEVMPKILNFIGNRIVVSHNTIGDLKFIRYFAKTVSDITFDNFFICTHLLSEKYLAESPDKSLKGLANYLDVHFEGAHRAEADALITWKLFQVLIQRALDDGIMTIHELIRKQGDYESGFRLGWGVPKDTLQNIPARPGIYKGYDINQEILYCGVGNNLKREVQGLTKYSELPKPMLKKVFCTYSLQTLECKHLLEALKKEAQINTNHKLKYTGHYLNQRRLLTFYFETDRDNFTLSTGHCPRGALLAIGPLFDRKFAGMILKQIATTLNQNPVKNKISLTPPQFIAVYAYLVGQSEAIAADLTRRQRKIWSHIDKRKLRLYSESLTALDNLIANLKGEHSIFCDLTTLNGRYQYHTKELMVEGLIKDSVLKIIAESAPKPHFDAPKIDSRDIGGLVSKDLLKLVRNKKSRISEYEVWEYLCWSIFSNRGRKSIVFSP